MNNTKWNELRLAMYRLGSHRPRWRTKALSGYVSPWDGEWFYHFPEGGYTCIEWVEVEAASPEQRATVLAALREIHVPGEETGHGFRIYGYISADHYVSYI